MGLIDNKSSLIQLMAWCCQVRSHYLNQLWQTHGVTRPELGNGSLTVTNIYRQTSNIRRTLVGNEILDHSDVVGASPVGAAPTTSSFST